MGGFHAGAQGVYMRMLQRIGYDVTPIDWLVHPDMYAYFTGKDNKPKVIDAVVSADLPYAHMPLIKDYNGWEQIGNTNEHTRLMFYTPLRTMVKYGLWTMQDVVEYLPRVKSGQVSQGLETEIFAQNWDFVGRAFENAKKYLPGWTFSRWNEAANPTHSPGWKMKIAEKLSLQQDFIVVGLEPTYFQGLFPELQKITGPVSDGNTTMELAEPNKGVVIIQKDRSNISPEAERLLSTVCPGDQGLIWMDTYIEKRGGTSNPNKNYLEAVDAWLDLADTKNLVELWLHDHKTVACPGPDCGRIITSANPRDTGYWHKA